MNKPEILKPSELKETLKQSSKSDEGSKTLDQWISLVDKANSFITSLQSLGKNLKGIGTQQQETPSTDINKVETAYNQGVQQGKQQINIAPEIEIGYKTATDDLILKLDSLHLIGINDDATIGDFKTMIKKYKESGELENKIHDWIRQFVGVKA